MSACLRSPTAFPAQYLEIAPSVAKAAGVRAMETLGIVEAARDAQRRVRLMGLSLDEGGMPRAGDFPNREMDVARMGDKALRNRQASWTQPLAEAATKTGPWRKLLRASTNFEETRMHCGSQRTKGQNASRWMIWNSVSMREYAWISR